jgi:preprotein translocase subunit SecB
MKKSDFQLIKHRLIGVKYELNKEYYPKGENIDLEIAYKVLIDRVKGSHEATVTFIFTIFKDENDKTKCPFKIETIHEGVFKWAESITDEQANVLLKINAPAVLLSYDRSIISQLTSYSGIPQLIVPLINFRAEQVSPPGEPIDEH